MPPAKLRANPDESKPEVANTKDKNGHGSLAPSSNGKSRRVASSAASHLRDVTAAASLPSAPSAQPVAQEASNPGLQWPSFDRSVLHAYRRVYHLDTPPAFANEYRRLVLSQPGGIGARSPTVARRKELRRQSKDQLANTARKHFNGLGTREDDVIVEFLHKIKNQGTPGQAD